MSLYQSCLNLLERLSGVPDFEEYLNPDLLQSTQAGTPSGSSPNDPVNQLWVLFRLGSPLACIFNGLRPLEPLKINSTDNNLSNVNACKALVFRFLVACRKELQFSEDDLFSITELYQDDTNGFVKVKSSLSFFPIPLSALLISPSRFKPFNANQYLYQPPHPYAQSPRPSPCFVCLVSPFFPRLFVIVLLQFIPLSWLLPPRPSFIWVSLPLFVSFSLSLAGLFSLFLPLPLSPLPLVLFLSLLPPFFFQLFCSLEWPGLVPLQPPDVLWLPTPRLFCAPPRFLLFSRLSTTISLPQPFSLYSTSVAFFSFCLQHQQQQPKSCMILMLVASRQHNAHNRHRHTHKNNNNHAQKRSLSVTREFTSSIIFRQTLPEKFLRKLRGSWRGLRG